MMEPIVVTGIGTVTPIGRSREETVNTLLSRQSGIEQVRIKGLPDPIWFGRVKADCSAGFDRGDVSGADRALAFAMAAAEDAWKEAGIPRGRLAPERGAVVVSSSKGLIGNLLSAADTFQNHQERNDDSPGGSRVAAAQVRLAWNFANFAGDCASRSVARALGFTGPALNYPAACATGAASIIAGIHLLRDGVADFVLAGSTEASGQALILGGFESMGALAPELSRPFHRDRNGFNAGEGAAVFALERESDALRRGARPLARIVGWDLRADAFSATGLDPQGQALEYSVRRVLIQAGWNNRDGNPLFISAHGTGTKQNDAVEAKVLARIFGPDRAGGPLVSGIKPYIGHLLGASASVELALALLAVRAGYLPPTLGLDVPDPAFAINHVPAAGISIEMPRVLKLSLGFGGHIGVLAVVPLFTLPE